MERELQPLYRIGDLLANRFRIEKVLGTGASGVVYGVWDSVREGRVALKVLWERAGQSSPAFQRLRREIGASQRAPDLHLLAIHDLLFINDHPVLVMEWVVGETLRDRIRRTGALPWREAVDLSGQVLEALAHLHSLGIVHRDVKSGNILLGEDGRARLADFGLVKGEDLGGTLTETGTSLGTPGYMAPEVIRGGEATKVSDLYGVGAVLFEMLSGRLPFQGANTLEVASRQLAQPAPLEPLKERRAPRWLTKITARLLERDPADRFPTASSVLEALRRRSPGFAVARRWRQRVAIFALLVVAAAGLYALTTWMARQAPLDIAYHGRTLEARNSSGKMLWRHEMPRDIQTALYGRFGPGGSPAVACTITWDPSVVAGAPSEEQLNGLYLFDRGGTVLSRTGLGMEENPFEERYGTTLSTHRFSREGHDLLVLEMRHAMWYPCALQVIDFDSSRGDGALCHVDCYIYNSGHLPFYGYRDLDGDGVDEVVYAGVNNRLYWADVVGAAKLDLSRSPWPTQNESPDVQSTHSPLFYRCFSFLTYSEMNFFAQDPDRPIRVAFSGGPSLWLSATGALNTSSGPLVPSEGKAKILNAGMANLCRLRDLGKWTDLLHEAQAWSAGAEGIYVWLGRLFQVQALMGLGRYDQAIDLIKSAEPPDGDRIAPPYAYQFLVDSLFLEGRYESCLETMDTIPERVRTTRPELAVSTAWAAVYFGDPSAIQHWLAPGTFNRYTWEPSLFRAISHCLLGNYGAADKILEELRANLGQRISDPSKWMVVCLIREGKIGEARRVMNEAQAMFPSEHLDQSELEVWLRWNEGRGGEAVVAEFDEVLAKSRQEAATNVEARALLPLTLARAAAMHRQAGERARADELLKEAEKLAPPSWRGILESLPTDTGSRQGEDAGRKT